MKAYKCGSPILADIILLEEADEQRKRSEDSGEHLTKGFSWFDSVANKYVGKFFWDDKSFILLGGSFFFRLSS